MKKLDIRRVLSKHNMSQLAHHRKTDVSPQGIYMAIKSNPTHSKFIKIAEDIGCDITDLFVPKQMTPLRGNVQMRIIQK